MAVSASTRISQVFDRTCDRRVESVRLLYVEEMHSNVELSVESKSKSQYDTSLGLSPGKLR